MMVTQRIDSAAAAEAKVIINELGVSNWTTDVPEGESRPLILRLSLVPIADSKVDALRLLCAPFELSTQSCYGC